MPSLLASLDGPRWCDCSGCAEAMADDCVMRRKTRSPGSGESRRLFQGVMGTCDESIQSVFESAW